MARPKEFDYDEKLVEARNLFWRKGYSATSMSDLEQVMQINRSSMYQTYGTKHQLFLKSLESYIQKIKDRYSKIAKDNNSPFAALTEIIYTSMNFAIEDANCLFTKSVFELAFIDNQVGNIIKNHAENTVAFFEALIKEAQNKKEIPPQDPKILAHFLVSGLSSINYNQIVFQDKDLTKQNTDFLVDKITR